MYTVFLAGGMGTRLSEETLKIPKPMIKIGKYPILFHIMKHYSDNNFKKYIVCGGYKHEYIKKKFNRNQTFFKNKKLDWSVNIVNTGLKTQTGARIKKIKRFIKDENLFFMTYGDGVSNVNIKKLLQFHKKHKKIATLTAVRPPARFGTIKLSGNKVSYFREKSSLDEGWINGGFFVMNSEFLKFIKNDYTFLEREPFEYLTKKNQLAGYKHKGFWQCMDTLRDKEILEKKIKKKNFE